MVVTRGGEKMLQKAPKCHQIYNIAHILQPILLTVVVISPLVAATATAICAPPCVGDVTRGAEAQCT